MANNYGPQLALNANRFLSHALTSHILSPGQIPAPEADCGYRSRPLVLPRESYTSAYGAPNYWSPFCRVALAGPVWLQNAPRAAQPLPET